MKLKINKDLPGFKKDQTVTVDADAEGTPLLKFWRDRLHDSKVDGCVEILHSAHQTKQNQPQKDTKHKDTSSKEHP